ncbi:MAG: peptidoglycan DD-metalloendopeptidase family protein [Candidatus Aminicenantes bacterium]|nr:peptidoglycan DD-metalloendopeptidase family protein [Candidatus Aminicenantes bacterium]
MNKKLIPLFTALLLLFASSQEKLRVINLRIEEISAKLLACKQDKSSILNDIYALELQTEAVVIGLNKVDLLMADTRAQIARKQKEEERLQAKIRSSQDKVRRILRVLYKIGELGYVKLFINIGNFDQLFRNYRLIVSLMDERVMAIREIRQGLMKLQKIKAELQVEFDRQNNLRKEQSGKLSRLQGLKQEKLELIAKINRQRDFNVRLLEELKNEGENLTRFLDQRTVADVLDRVDFKLLKGQLAWPLPGSIISSFGKKKSANFNTYTMNNGIEIKPVLSDEIKAIGGGEIIFCDYFKGYGNLLIIQHAGNFHTLYGHCDSFKRKLGEQVQVGEVIALAGNSGSIYGKSLYFEIRQNLKPLDPLLWLSKR